MYCNNCGAKCEIDSIYCEKCGHKLGTTVTDMPVIKNEKNNSSKKIILISLVCFLVLFLSLSIVWFIFLGEKTKDKNELNNNNTVNSDGICDYIEDVDSDFSFTVVHDENGQSSVNVVDENNNTVSIRITSEFDNTYIMSPVDGYKEGMLYKIVLKNGKFINEMYNKYNDVCFKVKKKVIIEEEKKEEFKIGTYVHKDNSIVLNSDNTFTISVSVNGEIITYKGNYKIENYVLTCNAFNDDETNFGVFEFNINSEGDLSSLNTMGISEYSDVGTVYSYRR